MTNFNYSQTNFLTECAFEIRHLSDTSSICSISAGVPQGGILSPILYNIFSADQPITLNTSAANYADYIIYKILIKPIWTYGIQLWKSAKKANLNKIQSFQNIDLRKLINAAPYIPI